MKKLFLLASLITWSCFGFSQLEGIVVDIIEHSDTEGNASLSGQTTYRVYAQLASPNDQVSNIQGSLTNPLTIETTTSFYRSNDNQPSITGDGLNQTVIDFVPGADATEYVSMLTVGRLSNTFLGVPTSSDTFGKIAGTGEGISVIEDGTAPSWIASFTNGGNINISSAVGGGWFTFPNGVNSRGTDINNSVLIGQFTTDGDFTFDINVAVFPEEGEFIEYFSNVDAGLGLSFDSNDLGCADATACNYNSDPATIEDGSCIYADAELCEACSGETDGTGTVVVTDADGDGVCDADEVTGCTDAEACNFDSNPTTDTDNSLCIFPVDCETCVDGVIINNDADGDGVCDADEVTGCTDETACNYDSNPTTDTDNTICIFPVDCETCIDGVIVDNDADGDGVCDADEVTGCTDETACNYDSNPTTDTDNTLCIFPVDCETCIDGVIVDNDADGDGVCDADEVTGCTDETACNYDSNPTTDTDNTLCIFPVDCETCIDGVIVDNDADGDGVCDADEVTGCTDETACNYDSNPTTDTDNTLCTFPVDCETCIDGVIVNNDADGDGVCDADEVTGCTDETACNYDSTPTTDTDNTLCTFPVDCETCVDGVIVNNDADGDGVCDGDELTGCTDETACNYDSNPTTDTDNTLCIFPVDCETCVDGVIVDNDADGDGICDADETEGCTNPDACNYNMSATDDDGSCATLDECGNCGGTSTTGCTNNLACNYDADADCDDGSCVVPTGCESCAADGSGTIVDNDADDDGVCDANEIAGCTNPEACNYNMAATDEDGSCILAEGCETCSGETDGTGTVLANDADGDGVCDADEISGCTNPEACNYNMSATDEDDSCILPEGCETCSGETDGTGTVLANDADGDGVCDADEISGCTNPEACNYNMSATDEDDSCILPEGCDTCSGETDGTGTIIDNPEIGASCDDGNENTIGDVIQENCECAGIESIPGCLDPNASNFVENANTDDGSCLYLCDTDPADLLDVTNDTGFAGSPLAYGSSSGMGLLAGANNDFAGFIWSVNTAGLTNDDFCISLDFTVEGDADDFPRVIEFRIENNGCGFFPCPWNDFNMEIPGPGTYTLGGLVSTGTPGPNGAFDPAGANASIVAAIANFSGTPLTGDVTVQFSNLCVSTDCGIISGCTNPEALNYDETANLDDGSCVFAVPGCTYSFALNFNPEATEDDGSCEEKIEGCTNEDALNFNAEANVTDDEACIFTCQSCAGDFDGNGFVNVIDLSGFLGVFGTPCAPDTAD